MYIYDIDCINFVDTSYFRVKVTCITLHTFNLCKCNYNSSVFTVNFTTNYYETNIPNHLKIIYNQNNTKKLFPKAP